RSRRKISCAIRRRKKKGTVPDETGDYPRVSEIELHRKLLGDAVRNAALADALKRTIKPGMTVADLGAGTGFLSFLARRLGASQCHLYEYTATLELAQQLA